MTLDEYLRSYTDDELTQGAELYYAGDISDYFSSNYETDTNASLGSMSAKVHVSGCWKQRAENGKLQDRTCFIDIYKKLGIIAFASCSCDHFQRDMYGCPHTAALLTAYVEKEHGEDFFRSTKLQTLLQAASGVEDPFVPGVLKRTDDRLSDLLAPAAQQIELPKWQPKLHTKDQFRIECNLRLIEQDSGKNRCFIDIRFGSGRCYIIRDLPEFLAAYRSGGYYPLGRNEVQIAPELCSAGCRKILDIFSELKERSSGNSALSPFYRDNNNSYCRYIELPPIQFDSFMSTLNGSQIEVDSVSYRVNLNYKGLSASLRKKAHGAQLRVKSLKLLTASFLYLYLIDETNGIFRIRLENAGTTDLLRSLFSYKEALYIRESDLPKVCRQILPVFQEYGTIDCKGVDIENYGSENPKFTFHLDYTDDGVLTCVPYVAYPVQNISCPLYDDRTGIGRRNGKQERTAAALLQTIFQDYNPDTTTLSAELNDDELYDFMKDSLPKLEALGTVMATDTLKKSRVRSLPNVKVGVSVQTGNLLMNLAATGLEPQEMAEILKSYTKKKRYFRLTSGEYFSLEDQDTGTWDTLSELYRHYGKKSADKITIPLYRALYLREMLGTRENTEFNPAAGYKKLLKEADNTEKGHKTQVPDSLRSILRPYQTEGFRWIKMLKRCGFGGILADDMGLGKTLQVLTFLLSEKEDGKCADELRTLIVCPASLVYNWLREIRTYTPALTVQIISGTADTRRQLIEGDADADVWITSYDLLKRDIEEYENIAFANEIIDEAQYIKNQSTQAAQSVRVIKSGFRMALTGTPIENHLSELWSILDYLMPGFLYNYRGFEKEYEIPIVVQKDEEALTRLKKMVHPFILRRLKKQVLKELPDKLEEVVTVRLSGEQKKLYDATAEQIRLALDKTTPEEFRSGKLELLSQLTRLRQVCCDPSLLYENYDGESAKLDACLELVEQAIDGGHKLLLFSQFTKMLDIICERLTSSGIAYHRIDGSVSKESRMEMVDSFADDDIPVFCISLKAGGTGLNLTAADIVIHYDPWWNKAAQNQATDRAHRIGQTETVSVYELIAEGTIEEQIQLLKSSKSHLAEDVLSGESISSALISKEDMMVLLE